MKRGMHLLNALLALGLLAFSIYVYPELPDRIPSHFNISGEPDAWSNRTWLSWLILPLIGLGTCGLVYVIALLAPARPSFVNLPDKKKLLELPPDRQRWVLEGLSICMYRMVTVMLAMFAVLQYAAYRTAVHGHARNEVLGGVLIGLIALPIVSLGALAVVQSRLDRAYRDWRRGVASTA